jgi:ATP-dependent DNA helicase RecG
LDKIPLFFKEYYPKDFLKEFDLLELTETVKNLHFPYSWDLLKKAKYRLWFDKLLKLQLVSLLNKKDYSFDFKKDYDDNFLSPERQIIKNFLKTLPFQLTKAQKKVIKQIVDDFHS